MIHVLQMPEEIIEEMDFEEGPQPWADPRMFEVEHETTEEDVFFFIKHQEIRYAF